jgi:spermidine synthase
VQAVETAPAADEPAGARRQERSSALVLSTIFFVSGFPALVYQLLWQRALFTIYGINIESITIVVSAFMLGLGIGSFAGGAISKRSGVPHLLVFGAAEVGIGLFGLASLQLFNWVGVLTLEASTLQTGVYTFIMVLVPTVLMGATLPILVAHLVRASRNVGRSVGLLYFVNTMGSALSCFAAGLWLFGAFGMHGSVVFAAVINFAVGAGALVMHVVGRGADRRQAANAEPAIVTSSASALPFTFSLVLASAVGFISLSYEILWARVYSFVSGSAADAFPFLLGAFLLGIALGSSGVRRYCDTVRPDALATYRRLLGRFLLVVNGLGFFVVPIVAFSVKRIDYHWSLVVVTAAAAGLGASLPLICHLGIAPDERAGQRLSWIYLSNIVGSTAGSLFTGFVLMDRLPLHSTALLLLMLGLGTAGWLLYHGEAAGQRRRLQLGLMAVFGVALVAASSLLFENLYERLMYNKKYKGQTFAHVVETKSGVVTVASDGKIYGGGIYDGRFSVDLVNDKNMIVRPFALSAFHPNPKDILVIGLSSGSWSQVMVNHPQVDKVTAIEINPGYLELIPQFPATASLLSNPKFEVQIADGRRWLRKHQDARFDVIVMNTTHHWRSNASNVLSLDFWELARSRLKPGGVIFYNTTSSKEAQRTGATAFPYAMRVVNFMVVSDSPLDVSAERWRQVLASYRIDDKPVLDLTNPEHQKRLDDIVGMVATLNTQTSARMSFETRDSILERTVGAQIITDDNMGTEWQWRWRKWAKKEDAATPELVVESP